MKFIVDEIPKKPTDCLFSYYSCECMSCKIDGERCALESNYECEYLKKVGDK